MNIDQIDRVMVIGAGGTGSILLPLLARYLFSQKYNGQFIIADGDSYSESNMSRQLFGHDFLNTNKAEYQGMLLSAHLPAFSDNISIVDKYLSKDDVNKIIDEFTIVINCTDNKAIRKYVEDRCLELKNAIHICCGNELHSGQVQVSTRCNGQQITPSIYEEMPELNSDNDDRSKLSCEQLAELPSGGQLIAANATAAVLALNIFLKVTHPAKSVNGQHVGFNSVWFECFSLDFETKGRKRLDLDALIAASSKTEVGV